MTTNNAINNIYKDGRLADIKYYTSSTTWTKPSNMLDDDFIIIELVGGGGGSASTVSTGASASSVSGSGAGAGYSYKKIFGSALASSETVTIGAGGVGATSSGGGGGSGTTTSFGSHASASGGSGGGAGVAAFTPSGLAQIPPAIAGIGTGGDINITGARPNKSLVFYNEGIVRIPDIRSGGSALSTSFSSRGSSGGGRFPGGGACGAGHGALKTSRPGAAGASGLIIIWEYY
jgi:hypothetical protein